MHYSLIISPFLIFTPSWRHIAFHVLCDILGIFLHYMMHHMIVHYGPAESDVS